jgi:uncharacterized protein
MTQRQSFILAALSTAKGASFSPVQIQKFFFLLDKNLGQDVGAPHFDFKPYNYGPFDTTVYRELENLASEGLIDIQVSGSWRTYRLSTNAQPEADKGFAQFSKSAQDYIKRASDFVRSLSFSELVSAIYKAYPKMRQRSVFQE